MADDARAADGVAPSLPRRVATGASNVQGPGRSAPALSERRDIAFAAAYMAAATENGFEHHGTLVKVADNSPVKTIVDAYGVSRRTATRWRSADRAELYHTSMGRH